MVAILFRITSIIVFLVFSSLACAIDDAEGEIIAMLQRNLSASISDYGKRIEICEQFEKAAVLGFSSIHFNENVSRSEIATILLYLSLRNRSKCSIQSRMKLAYDLGMLRKTKQHYQFNTNDIFQIETNLIYPSIKELELEIRYLETPLTIRQEMEKVIGDSPFDWQGAMEKMEFPTTSTKHP